MIAAPQGHSGKTTVCIGLCASLKHQGFRVQPFKKGPDFIDPSWLTAASGRSCHNLDPYLVQEDQLVMSFQSACVDADVAIIEGAMGLYDSYENEGNFSSAYTARLLSTPVILVINAARMTTSIAAMVNGYRNFEPLTNITGIILNNISGKRHEEKLRAAITKYCCLPVVGAVPRDIELSIKERHLGLIPFTENNEAALVIDRIHNKLKGCFNIDRILALARNSPVLPEVHCEKHVKEKAVKIGVVMDNIFNFYYSDNLNALQDEGAELVSINSLKDDKLPSIDGLYIGGGFPEMFLPQLVANRDLMRDIARAIDSNMPVYAECAGLMYLSRSICYGGRSYEMIGIIPADIEIFSRPQGHGYTKIEVQRPNHWFPSGTIIKGHEFHYSRMCQFSENSDFSFLYRMKRGCGINGEEDGIVYKNMLASYTHLHAHATPNWATSFVALVKQAKNGEQCRII
jgi:cobyrinic acid a,c-diamide synthase